MFGKKKEPVAVAETKCKICGLECLDETTLKKHIEWKHAEVKVGQS
ncbi:MAG: hypothetical protein GX631_11325 [Dehalococcoidales bacterium]|nr:hypothetical protein [Dehalococcoidales bacterium]